MRFYFQYTPTRRGLTGAEYLDSYIDEHHPNVKWYPVISDGFIHYGFLESNNSDSLAKAIAAIEGKFSAQRLTEEEFIGAVYLLYDPTRTTPFEGSNPPSFTEFMNNYGIAVTEDNALTAAKAYKRKLFKEIVRKRFEDYNDLSADITKVVTLLNVYYPNLTAEEKATVDNLLTTISTIYSKEACINALQNLVNKLTTYLIPYYNTLTILQNITTKEGIANSNLDI